ncbi:hypothetical protein E4U39_005109, partial [Claviceps sp. Clav50 group G5]
MLTDEVGSVSIKSVCGVFVILVKTLSRRTPLLYLRQISWSPTRPLESNDNPKPDSSDDMEVS